jgi:hypothetical protein
MTGYHEFEETENGFTRVDPLYAQVTYGIIKDKPVERGGLKVVRMRTADLAAELRKAREQTP